MLSSRERVLKALNHQEADRVPLDLGGGPTSGMHVSSVYVLRQALGLDAPGTPVKVIEPFQMLGEIKPDLIEALGRGCRRTERPAHVLRLQERGLESVDDLRRHTGAGARGVQHRTRTQRRSSCCTRKVIIPSRPAAACRPAAGTSTPSSASRRSTMPTSTSKTTWRSSVPSLTRIWRTMRREAERLYTQTDKAILGNFGGTAFGDIALVPGALAQAPQRHP